MINVSINYQAIPLSPATLYLQQLHNLSRLREKGIIKTVASASNYSKLFNKTKLFEIVYSSNKNNFILILNTNLMMALNNCENNFKTIYEYINKGLDISLATTPPLSGMAVPDQVIYGLPRIASAAMPGGRRVKRHTRGHKKSRRTRHSKKSRRTRRK